MSKATKKTTNTATAKQGQPDHCPQAIEHPTAHLDPRVFELMRSSEVTGNPLALASDELLYELMCCEVAWPTECVYDPKLAPFALDELDLSVLAKLESMRRSLETVRGGEVTLSRAFDLMFKASTNHLVNPAAVH